MKKVAVRNRELRLAMVWNQGVQAEHVLKEPADVVLGSGANALFPLPESHALRGDVVLLSPLEQDGYSLLLPQGARGAVWLSGQRKEVSALLESNPSVRLGPDDYGVVSLGAVSYFFQQVRPSSEIKRNWFVLDGETLLSHGLSVFVHVCVILLMVLAERELPTEVTQELPAELISKFLVTPPPDELAPKVPKRADGLKDAGLRDKDEAGGKRDKGDQGKVGRKDAKQEKTEIADPNRGAVVQKVRGMGLLGALAGGDSLRAAFDAPSVGDLLSGLGSARTQMGRGSSGRGLRGVGTGGGGDGPGQLFGGGDLGTGAGSGSGSGAGRGKAGVGGRGRGRGEVAVQVSPGKPQVSGYLSAEQINRVVRANQAALRYCYESEVQRRRSLKGKVVIQWRVDRGGKVSTAKVASSTLNDSRVEGCLVRQVRKWRFPKPDGGEVSVMYPFIFGVRG